MPSNVKVTELSGYEEGTWWVQDAASALAVKCLPEIKGKMSLIYVPHREANGTAVGGRSRRNGR